LGGATGKSLQHLHDFSKGKLTQPSAIEAAGDIGLAGLEQGAYELGGAGIARVGKAIIPGSRAASLAYGSRSGELTPQIEKLIPDFDRTLSQAGLKGAKTVGEFEKVVRATERRLNQEYALALQPITGQKIIPTTVGDAIRNQITPEMLKTREGQLMASYLKRRAAEFDTEWTLGELNGERETVNKSLISYYNAAPSSAMSKARLDAGLKADRAADQALRDILYNAVDRSGAKPPGYFQALKQKQSMLIDLKDAVVKGKEGLTKASGERSGAPLREKFHLRGYLHPSTGMPGGVAGMNPMTLSDPMVQANKAIQRGFPSTGRKVYRGARKVVGTALSNRDINALPIRALFGDYNGTQEETVSSSGR
jgi:hypothetical protein